MTEGNDARRARTRQKEGAPSTIYRVDVVSTACQDHTEQPKSTFLRNGCALLNNSGMLIILRGRPRSISTPGGREEGDMETRDR